MPSPCRLGLGRTFRGTFEGTLQSWRTTWRSRWTLCSRRESTWSLRILARTGGTYPTRCSFLKASILHLMKISFAQKVIIFILILIITKPRINIHHRGSSSRIAIHENFSFLESDVGGRSADEEACVQLQEGGWEGQVGEVWPFVTHFW